MTDTQDDKYQKRLLDTASMLEKLKTEREQLKYQSQELAEQMKATDRQYQKLQEELRRIQTNKAL